MKRLSPSIILVLSLFFQTAVAQTPAVPNAAKKKSGATPAPLTAKPDELAKLKDRTELIADFVQRLKALRAAPELVTDVEVYAHAGRMLLEYPDMFTNQAAIDHAFTTLDQGSTAPSTSET